VAEADRSGRAIVGGDDREDGVGAGGRMTIRNGMERKETYEDSYDRRDARLKKLGQAIELWREKPAEQDQEAVDDYYEEAGRLEARLEATRHSLEELRERGDLQGLQDDIDEAIRELEEAVAKAAPRYQ